MSITSNRPTLPPVVELAAQVRSGMTLADVGAQYGASARSIQSRLNGAGYERTGEVQSVKRPAPRPNVAPPTVTGIDLTGALCRKDDPEVWFAEATLLAKYVCKGDVGRQIAGCPVREQCLEGALGRREEYGVFGGLDPRERKALMKKRAGNAA